MQSLDRRAIRWAPRLTAYLLFGAVCLRALATYGGSPLLLAIAAVLAVHLALLLSAGPLAGRFAWYPHPYLALQTALITSLISLPEHQDFFWLPFMALGLQAMRLLPPRLA